MRLRRRLARRRTDRGADHHLGGRREGVAGGRMARRRTRPRRPGHGRMPTSPCRGIRISSCSAMRLTSSTNKAICCPASRRSQSSKGNTSPACWSRAPAARRSPPFRYRDFGSLAAIGRKRAVVQMGKFKLTGFIAWLLWSVAHIYFLIGFRNRLIVAMNWMWNYLTFQRGTRLITGLSGARCRMRGRRRRTGCRGAAAPAAFRARRLTPPIASSYRGSSDPAFSSRAYFSKVAPSTTRWRPP